ncbi:MAG: hypothetical protein ACE5JG_08545 [Planctomycetota bacterium]
MPSSARPTVLVDKEMWLMKRFVVLLAMIVAAGCASPDRKKEPADVVKVPEYTYSDADRRFYVKRGLARKLLVRPLMTVASTTWNVITLKPILRRDKEEYPWQR